MKGRPKAGSRVSRTLTGEVPACFQTVRKFLQLDFTNSTLQGVRILCAKSVDFA
jgi:hypothetical protein